MLCDARNIRSSFLRPDPSSFHLWNNLLLLPRVTVSREVFVFFIFLSDELLTEQLRSLYFLPFHILKTRREKYFTRQCLPQCSNGYYDPKQRH